MPNSQKQVWEQSCSIVGKKHKHRKPPKNQLNKISPQKASSRASAQRSPPKPELTSQYLSSAKMLAKNQQRSTEKQKQKLLSLAVSPKSRKPPKPPIENNATVCSRKCAELSRSQEQSPSKPHVRGLGSSKDRSLIEGLKNSYTESRTKSREAQDKLFNRLYDDSKTRKDIRTLFSMSAGAK